MKRRRNKKRKLRLRHLLIIGVSIYIASILIHQNYILDEMNREKANYEITIEETKQEIASMEEQLEKIKAPEYKDDYIEKIAREDFKMIKSNEYIYIDKEKNKNKFIKGISQ